MRPYLQWLNLSILLLISAPVLFPGMLLPISWHPFVLGIVLFVGIFQWVVAFFDQRLRKRDPLLGTEQESTAVLSPSMWPICLMLLWLPLNLWASSSASTSWIACGYLLLGVTTYLVLITFSPFTSDKCALFMDRLQVIRGGLLVCIGTLLALGAPFIVIWKPQFRLFYLPLYDYLQDIQLNIGEAIHPNILAGSLVLSLPLTIVLTRLQSLPIRNLSILSLPLRNRTDFRSMAWLKVVIPASMMLQLIVLILSQSRGGYIAFSASLFVIGLLYWPRSIYLTPVIFFVGFMLFRTTDLQTILEQFSNDGSLGGWAGRLEIWQTSLTAISDFPFTGIGIGTFTTLIPLLYPLSFPIESYPHAHNLFLQIALDLGLPGLIAYLALLINLVAMLTVTLRKAPRHTIVHTLTIGAAGSLTATIVHGMLDAVLWGTKLSFLPWMLFALITQLFLQTQHYDKPIVDHQTIQT